MTLNRFPIDRPSPIQITFLQPPTTNTQPRTHQMHAQGAALSARQSGVVQREERQAVLRDEMLFDAHV